MSSRVFAVMLIEKAGAIAEKRNTNSSSSSGPGQNILTSSLSNGGGGGENIDVSPDLSYETTMAATFKVDSHKHTQFVDLSRCF